MSLSIKRKNPITLSLSLSLSLSLTQLCLSIKSENVVRFLPNPCVLIGSAAKRGRKALSLSLSLSLSYNNITITNSLSRRVFCWCFILCHPPCYHQNYASQSPHAIITTEPHVSSYLEMVIVLFTKLFFSGLISFISPLPCVLSFFPFIHALSL